MIKQLKKLLDQYDTCSNLECDGMTRVIHYVLTKNQIDHRIYYGSIRLKEKEMNTHFWIEIQNLIIDYRAKMWIPEVIEHGVFEKNKTNVEYIGNKINIQILPEFLFEILTNKKTMEKNR